MEKKCYILMVSRFFPLGHPQEGKETGFVKKILSGEKIHTIRGNYKFWKKRIDKINAGEAYLSVRYWTGKPYRSPQETFMEFSSMGIERVIRACTSTISMDNVTWYMHKDIAPNDGLSNDDFVAWFKGKEIIDNAILHFTDFRYESHKS